MSKLTPKERKLAIEFIKVIFDSEKDTFPLKDILRFTVKEEVNKLKNESYARTRRNI